MPKSNYSSMISLWTLKYKIILDELTKKIIYNFNQQTTGSKRKTTKYLSTIMKICQSEQNSTDYQTRLQKFDSSLSLLYSKLKREKLHWKLQM